MSKLQPARGTRDIYGEDARRMAAVVDCFKATATQYGFEEIQTPIFEFTEVFKRPLGEASDIVSKEMYSFEDRGGEEVTLRPEFTAGICRAFISNGMQQSLPQRLMAWGPVFRYERPQKGRYRQFHQIDAEILGADSPETDVDLIALAWRMMKQLGIADDTVLHLNSLGDAESRQQYRVALVEYLNQHKDNLSEDSQRRLETNPLRILDSKNEGDREIIKDAPSVEDHMTEEAAAFIASVQNGLTALGIPYVMDDKLVRGLDYYNHTVFEFITTALGAQGTVLAGGRFDGLVSQLGGAPTPGVGFAGGIERLAMLMKAAPAVARSVVLLPMGEAATLKAFPIGEELRDAGFDVVADRSGNLKKRLNRANKNNARVAIILGDNELEQGVAQVKDLDSGEQTDVALDMLKTVLAPIMSGDAE
ncbi:histidine--tRNA ligase [Kordiimonas sediminis]|uniref:Histidine--tRNA ligase n=1 Tax=Kordiimonas sediminis TaxID=1735581 RepID=A0A919E1J7_9PROT|nr:histidine--tRNA ligase [Kordiimonas sediminis]GHF10441.1 histidine--tRNA ligase [Kordiimonas sediminis]